MSVVVYFFSLSSHLALNKFPKLIVALNYIQDGPVTLDVKNLILGSTSQ